MQINSNLANHQVDLTLYKLQVDAYIIVQNQIVFNVLCLLLEVQISDNIYLHTQTHQYTDNYRIDIYRYLYK